MLRTNVMSQLLNVCYSQLLLWIGIWVSHELGCRMFGTDVWDGISNGHFCILDVTENTNTKDKGFP